MSKQVCNPLALTQSVLMVSLLGTFPAIAMEQNSDREIISEASNETIKKLDFATNYQLSNLDESLAQVPVNPHNGFGEVQPELGEVNSQTQLNEYFQEGRNSRKKQQVTSVSQLSDVQPTDWAFQALQSLVERYGCISGYPDGTYKGNRALTRYEFAAGVNACLERINELINASTADLVTREDLATLQRLMEEFAAELAALRGRVTVLEARAAELEANQFSTTTKLGGEVIFWISDTFGDRAQYTIAGGPNVEDSDDPTQTFFGYRVRLDFLTSFTGQDTLLTRVQASDVTLLSDPELTNTFMTIPSVDDGVTDSFVLDDLFYIFPVFNGKGEVYLGANSLDLDDVQDPLSPISDETTGVISAFARYNPATFRGPQGTGAALKYTFNDQFQLNLSYLANDAANPEEGFGLFNGAFSASAQLIYQPTDNLVFAVDYNRRYFNPDDVFVAGSTGSFIANKPFGDNATTSDNLGFQFNWRVFNNFEFGGWFGSTWADQKQGGDDNATVINWATTLAFPDLLKEGDMLGIVVGMPPKMIYHTIDDLEEDDDTSIHIESFYRFQINEYIGITPGFYIITDPEHDSRNDTIFVGVFRTLFQF
ncbi:iron uptake porin [Capilliphycus salinus ALCB114379]|uniref:iron uptake porin n=1 Tax=Capilliphycus salinus TaxID=2768948 RepID=UPI0039A532F9